MKSSIKISQLYDSWYSWYSRYITTLIVMTSLHSNLHCSCIRYGVIHLTNFFIENLFIAKKTKRLAYFLYSWQLYFLDEFQNLKILFKEFYWIKKEIKFICINSKWMILSFAKSVHAVIFVIYIYVKGNSSQS
jgi:hypothetical protein